MTDPTPSASIDPANEVLMAMHAAYWGTTPSGYWHANSRELWLKAFNAARSALSSSRQGGAEPVAWIRIEDVLALKSSGRALVYIDKPANTENALPMFASPAALVEQPSDLLRAQKLLRDFFQDDVGYYRSRELMAEVAACIDATLAAHPVRESPSESAREALDCIFRENAVPMSDRNGRLYDMVAAASGGAEPAVKVCCQQFGTCREPCCSRADYWQGRTEQLLREQGIPTVGAKVGAKVGAGSVVEPPAPQVKALAPGEFTFPDNPSESICSLCGTVGWHKCQVAAAYNDAKFGAPAAEQPTEQAWAERRARTLLAYLWRKYDAGGESMGRSHEAVLLETAMDLLDCTNTGEMENKYGDQVDEARRFLSNRRAEKLGFVMEQPTGKRDG